MQILILEHLIRQTQKKNKLSKLTIDRIYKELYTLADVNKQGRNSLMDYLYNQNGKQLKGSDNIFKHRLTDGDRILYTYGKYLDYIGPEDKDSLVLLAYAKHDDQGKVTSLPTEQRYETIEEVVGIADILCSNDLDDFGIDDIDAFVSLVLENYQSKYAIYVQDPEKINLEDEDNDEWAFLLSPDQGEILADFICDVKPTLIMGGAGTGKTVLAVHLLNELSSEVDNVKCAYFTQSRELLKRVIQQYETLSGSTESENLRFYDINEYCFEKLINEGKELKRTNFVQTTQFLKFAEQREISKEIEKLDVSVIDVWTEIRGVIKGSLNDNWLRNTPMSMYEFSNEVIKELEQKGLILRNEKDKQKFILGEVKETFLSENSALAYQHIRDYFAAIDWSLEEMSFDEYLVLSGERTMIEPNKRTQIYGIYTEYKKWLHQNDYFDENDLVRMVMETVIQKNEFDYIIVDEVQDYTELQIMMIDALSKKKEGIVYAGDSHQIINPTVFDDRKLKKLHSNLNTTYLGKNFRCQREIVKMGNSLANLRREKIASGKGSKEEPETSTKQGNSIVKVQYSEEILKQILEELLKYPNVAVLTADSETKDYLISLIGRDKYEGMKNPIIFHISEIKGMEYKFVFGYNLITRFKDEWNVILSDGSTKRTRYRYYFNVLYVAITRAQNFLDLMESDDCDLLNLLENNAPEEFHYKRIEQYNIDALNISQLSNLDSDWEEQAERYFEAGKYEEALQNYLKAGASISKINACKAEIAIENKDYVEAMRYFILVDNKSRIRQYQNELDSKSVLHQLVLILLEPEVVEDYEDFDGKKLTAMIEAVFPNDECQEIFERLILQINTSIESLLKE